MNLFRKSIFMIFTLALLGLTVLINMEISSYAKDIGAASNDAKPHNIMLKRVFLDGEISEEMIHDNGLNTQQLYQKYKGWKLQKADSKTVIFQKSIDDISPLLKANGFFGITSDGTVTIFNGNPHHEEIIHSFFQIDVKKLEGRKQTELLRGIPVKSKEDFNKVLKALQQYSIPSQKN